MTLARGARGFYPAAFLLHWLRTGASAAMRGGGPEDETVLLSTRKMLIIHFLMRLPDFVRPVVYAADRFVERFVARRFAGLLPSLALVKRAIPPRRLTPRSRGRMPERLPRSQILEG